jgi:hypothetical protein
VAKEEEGEEDARGKCGIASSLAIAAELLPLSVRLRFFLLLVLLLLLLLVLWSLWSGLVLTDCRGL